MISAQRRNEIRCALGRFRDGNLAENARNLLDLLRYTSNRTLKIEPNTALEKAIEKLIYALYGLTEAEIRIVEQKN